MVELDLTSFELYDLGRDGDEASAKRIEKCDKYAVFHIDRQKLAEGKRRGVFDLVYWCLVQKVNPLPKKIISPLVAACLQPHRRIVPGQHKSKANHNPVRPTKVLFQTDKAASHPQVRLFMSMMGFTADALEVVDSKLIELLAETKDKITAPSKKEFPYLHDHARGIKCDGCGKVGPTLRKCSCMEVYYCSRECQKKQWSSHEADHKEVMKIKASQN